MASHHGTVAEFSGIAEDWEAYMEQLESYFVANDITTAAKKRAVLLSSCGTATYKLIRSVVAPEKPTDVSYADLTKKLREHFAPKPSPIMQRFKFNTCIRQTGEKIADYVARLRELTHFCEFGDTVEDMLRDRLVCGVSDKGLQKRLLAEPQLTFKKAMELSQTHESVTQNAKDLQSTLRVSGPVHIVSSKVELKECYRCGGQHNSHKCKYKESLCHYCKKKGHLAKKCHQRQKSEAHKSPLSKKTHHIETDQEVEDCVYTMFPVSLSRQDPIQITINVDNCPLTMELDTGASLSIISEKVYKTLPSAPKLQPTSAQLRTYTGESIKVLGYISVKVCHNSQEKCVPLLVVSGEGPSLLGRDWLEQLKLDWTSVCHLHSEASVEDILARHRDVFNDELGTVQGITVKLHINPESVPKFCKTRPMPFSLKKKVEYELDRLEAEGVISPVRFSDWATPIVPVAKRDGSVRICGDYKVTLNQVLKTEVYPLPRIEELFAALAGGVKFTKLDLSYAYQQLVLEEESAMRATINTHKGLYKYNRLPFGVATAPALFQRVMESLLKDLPYVCIYLDDILVTGKTQAEHLSNLDEVLTRLQEAGVRLKESKCAFMMSTVEYLGHKITKDGLQPSESKVEAVIKAPTPSNVTELKVFLGLINYYGKFISNLSTTAVPLHRLLVKGTEWKWGEQQETAFQTVKNQLASSKLLVHYDPELQLILSCDASPYGIGAVLAHRFDDGSERPIAYVSWTLAAAERKYCHLDKEALAIVFGLSKFHQYLFGRKFVIYTDHKPLSYLFDASRAVPQMASARIQRWAITLSVYSYTIEYKRGQSNSNADALSRLPLPDQPAEIPTPADTIFLLDRINSTPVTAAMIRRWTQADPVLSKVKAHVMRGWKYSTSDLRPYFRWRSELSVKSGCILCGHRVIVPVKGRAQVVELLHESHPGIERMKRLAREYVWWPDINNDIEQRVKSCNACQITRNTPEVAPLHPWEWPDKPWSRIHVDYAGPFLNRMFLLIVDAHSKWLDIHVTTSSTSAVIIQKLQQTFATLGLPETLISDNGTAFTSLEFQEFMKQNGISHLRTAPYHPSSNGLAERSVQTFKAAMKRMQGGGSVESKVSRFLFKYRVTPHCTTGVSPAELMFGRPLRTHLDLLQPKVKNQVMHSQRKKKQYHDEHCKQRQFLEGDSVYVKDFSGKEEWLPGIITKIQGPLSYLVELEDERVVRRHMDHVKVRVSLTEPRDSQTNEVDEVLPPSVVEVTDIPSTVTTDAASTTQRPVRPHKPPSRLIEELD